MKIKSACLVLLLSGCVHYMPAMVSTTSTGHEKPVQTVTGISRAYYLFGFIGPIGDDSLNAAIEDALGYAPSDSMVNVFIDRRLICFPHCNFPIFSRIDTMIFGTLVKYDFAEKREVILKDFEGIRQPIESHEEKELRRWKEFNEGKSGKFYTPK